MLTLVKGACKTAIFTLSLPLPRKVWYISTLTLLPLTNPSVRNMVGGNGVKWAPKHYQELLEIFRKSHLVDCAVIPLATQIPSFKPVSALNGLVWQSVASAAKRAV